LNFKAEFFYVPNLPEDEPLSKVRNYRRKKLGIIFIKHTLNLELGFDSSELKLFLKPSEEIRSWIENVHGSCSHPHTHRQDSFFSHYTLLSVEVINPSFSRYVFYIKKHC
jgi:hypothetical protein